MMGFAGTMIKVNGIRHKFRDKEVLHNVSFRVGEGEIFGLLGPSGAGKTTLINILTGQLQPTGGSCAINGVESTRLSGEQRMQMGIMMDDFGLYDRMSCYDNLKFYQMLDGKGTEDIQGILEKVGLLQAKKTPFMNLSKGMKNRLAFARAILRKPRILFLDEPTSGLDPNTAEEIHNLILEEKKQGTTVFLTTHNMHEAEKLCDNIALLNEGCVVEYGTPRELCRKYNHQKKFVLHLRGGRDMELPHGKESAEQIRGYIEREELETIHTTEPNLEDIFMELTGKGLDK